MNAVILVSPGELLDKITILEIKKSRIKQKERLGVIKKELTLLNISLSEMLKIKKKLKTSLSKEKKNLYSTNLKLWNIENKIRAKEAKKLFDKEFIELARAVYITNDTRSAIKNDINLLFGSSIHEVKQYSRY
jgi:predicted  nucleic acid-binding Zn-ribbon protein